MAKKSVYRDATEAFKFVFKSLNCSLCSTPYSKTAKKVNTPTQTFCDDIQAMCTKCYKEQRAIAPAIRAHQCKYEHCFRYMVPPSHCLMELLTSGCFTLDKNLMGYVQTTQSITIPGCPICNEEYSIENSQREPFILFCGHGICNGCFATMSKPANKFFFKYALECPQCKLNALYSQESWENPLKTLLRELDEKSTQKEAEMKSICEDCRKEVSLLEMFRCTDCGDKMLCPRCSCKNHRLHQIIDLEVVEVKKLGKVTRETIIPQIEAYNVCFPELQSDLIKNFNECQKKILSRTDQLGYLNGFAKAKEQQGACIAFGERFETICEKYLGELRSFNTGIEKLIDDINASPK